MNQLVVHSEPKTFNKGSLVATDKINELVKIIVQQPQAELKTEHFYADEMYARKLFRPKGCLIVGKTHKKRHFYIIVTGSVAVSNGEDSVIYKAGDIVVSEPGSKKAVYALEDTVCITVHHTKKKNLEKIEKELIEDNGDLSLYGPGNVLKQELLK